MSDSEGSLGGDHAARLGGRKGPIPRTPQPATRARTTVPARPHPRPGVAIPNFARHLPTPHAPLAIEALKDPCLFGFLGLGDEALERDIENALIRHITRFLLELGAGFAF